MRVSIGLVAIGVATAIGWPGALRAEGGGAPPKSEPVVFEQICDASAVLMLRGGLLLVAEDASDVLRLYDPAGGPPVGAHDLYGLTGTPPRARQNLSAFEGIARQGDEIYVITSHARDEKGKNRPNRRRLLALKSTETLGGEKLEPTGIAYTNLKQQLSTAPELRTLALGAAIMELHRALPHLSPSKQGLDIEGLAAGPEGSLLVGLRNPRRADQAAVIPILNPERVVLGFADPEFGPPLRIDLGRLGIASLEWSPQESAYYVVAARHDAAGGTRLLRWSGRDQDRPMPLAEIAPADFAAEGLAVSNDGKRLLLVSDDGARPMPITAPEQCTRAPQADDTCACSLLADPLQKRFRGQWLEIASLPAGTSLPAVVAPAPAPTAAPPAPPSPPSAKP